MNCACSKHDCKVIDEYVNGDTDTNGICEDCFRDCVEITETL